MQTSTNPTPRDVALAAIDLLADEGIRAYWDYPGFIAIRVPGPMVRLMTYGLDGTWYGQVETAAAPWECSEIAELPHDATAEQIAAVLIEAYLREAKPSEARFPLTRALIDALDTNGAAAAARS